jgi:hypothetical protein
MSYYKTVALSFLFVSLTAQAEVKHVSDVGFIVSNSMTVSSTSQKAWAALVNDIDQWWPKDHTWWGNNTHLSIDPVAGGCFCEKYANNSAEHMRVSYVEPHKLLRMTGGLGPLQGMGMYGALDWFFVQNGDVTTIELTYNVQGISPEGFEQLAPIVDKVQAFQLKQLIKYIKK